MSDNPKFDALLEAGRAGDEKAREQLFTQIYEDLKHVALSQLRRSGQGIAISPTTLVHEAYIKFARTGSYSVENRRHFFNVLAQAMRQVLVDLIRRKSTVRHGSGYFRTTLNEDLRDRDVMQEEILTIDTALAQLEAVDPDLAELVRLHFFGGFSLQEIAETQGRGERTVRRHWEIARTLLTQIMDPTAKPDGGAGALG